MPLSNLYLLKNFSSPTSGNDYLIKTAQAADADEMARVYAKNLAEIVALNDAIQSNDDKFTPVDAVLTAGGDGHTFIYTVTLARAILNAPQQQLLGQQVIPWDATNNIPGVFTGLPTALSETDNPTLGSDPQPTPIDPAWINPVGFFTRFGVAASQEEVQAVHNKLIDQISADFQAAAAAVPGLVFWEGFYCPFQSIAGGSKGTRFMIAVTGLPVIKTLPPT